jgi:hypothetical protein
MTEHRGLLTPILVYHDLGDGLLPDMPPAEKLGRRATAYQQIPQAVAAIRAVCNPHRAADGAQDRKSCGARCERDGSLPRPRPLLTVKPKTMERWGGRAPLTNAGEIARELDRELAIRVSVRSGPVITSYLVIAPSLAPVQTTSLGEHESPMIVHRRFEVVRCILIAPHVAYLSRPWRERDLRFVRARCWRESARANGATEEPDEQT